MPDKKYKSVNSRNVNPWGELSTSGISNLNKKIYDLPDAPTVGTVTDIGTGRAYGNGAVTVNLTGAATGGPSTTFTATSTPGSLTATGSSSPLTVTGLTGNTSYTFTATASNVSGSSAQSSASSSVTATTVPDVPTSVAATNQGSTRPYNNGQASVSFAAGNNGGKSVSSFTVTSSPGGYTGTGASSPILITGLQSATAYTYSVTATNANGTSNSSSASGAVTATTVPQAPTIGTVSATDPNTISVPFTANATGGSSITSYTVASNPSVSLSTSGTTTPLTATGTFAANQAYTFTVAATNANGTSAASNASNSITPYPTYYESIATQTVGAGGTTLITFSSIPQTYTHLQLRLSISCDRAATGTGNFGLRFNGDTGTNYSAHTFVVTNGTTVSAANKTTGGFAYCGYISGAAYNTLFKSVMIIDILDYTSTTKYKTIKNLFGISSNVQGGEESGIGSGAWYNLSTAINSITLIANAYNFVQYSTAELYGIKGA